MPAYQTHEYEDYGDLLENMSRSITAINAFNTLLEMSLRAGEDMRSDGYGIHVLLDMQCKSLEAIEGALRSEFKEIVKSKLKIRNSETIAEWAGVSKYAANRVISIATGIDIGPPTERHTDEPPYLIKKETTNASA